MIKNLCSWKSGMMVFLLIREKRREPNLGNIFIQRGKKGGFWNIPDQKTHGWLSNTKRGKQPEYTGRSIRRSETSCFAHRFPSSNFTGKDSSCYKNSSFDLTNKSRTQYPKALIGVLYECQSSKNGVILR